ncbi:hypothetical protein [Undibacterium sp. TJN19]|uniref:hypothetical protein n=1 Tax=Undibacterium sp. TJN19 TaxID=3413055 RepID=UPI003BF34018
MFFLHHPQPVRPRKAVPELQVSAQRFAQIDTKTIVVECGKEDLDKLQNQSLEKIIRPGPDSGPYDENLAEKSKID